jgi:hypothetical protein
MTLVKAYADKVQPGDVVIQNNKALTVKYIDGPDRIGTFDFHCIDETGHDQIEIVTGLVTIAL